MNAHARDTGDRRGARHALAALWVVVFVGLAAAAGLRWNAWLGDLTRVGEPAPLSGPAHSLPAPSAGERAVTEARALLSQNQPAAALTVLETVSPQDAAYPFARTLSAQAQQALRQSGTAGARER